METRKFCQFLIAVSLMLMPVILFAAGKFVPLKADEAFILSVDVTGHQALKAEWKIQPGYFLYAKRLQITADAPVSVDATMPAPKHITGLDGEPEVAYMGNVSIPLTLQPANSPDKIQLTVKYQGCAQDGFCYPPMKKMLLINMSTGVVLDQNINEKRGFSLTSLLTDHNKIKMIFSTEHFAVTLLVFLCLGILLAFTPCVLPMLPILTGIIVGEKKLVSTKKAFFLSLMYVLGVAVTYAFAGIVASLAGSSIQIWMQQPVFVIILAVFLILLSLSLFEFFDLPISRFWQNSVMRWSARHQGGTYVGVFFMGIFSTLIVSPCVTAPMIGVLLYIAQTGNLVLGASALFTMGLGMGIPLIIVGMSAGKFLPKSGPWMRVIVKMFGLIMFGMAIWLLSRLLSHGVTVFIWGLYFIGIATFMYLVMPDLIRHRLVNRGLGLAAGGIGILLMLNSLGMTPYLNHWTGEAQSTRNPRFIIVHSSEELKAQISQAAMRQQPVLVDFYADWCEACVSMDKKVFDLDSMQKRLGNFVLIRADLTENTAADQELLQKYNVIAPPTVLFFTTTGQEVDARRIVGEVDAEEFSNRLKTFISEGCDKKVQC